ncbi:PREDICTED: stellacyanin-like [Nicotiana attenuata]|uniref:Mavicyanin n=1 Tax=Nicotiana attenuata TaxID=49451 RepID=A0A1J6IL26_NICAT|nr:PREDICTED: stellacyanin-like [Nicotiana attenuata]OIS99578.1 mavicyanin [Nicotiana attenuata]
MASTTLLIVLVVVVGMVAVPAMATDHLVGDDQGWKLDFNYTAWAATKEFHVGDKLIFKYKKEVHNVYKADQAAFQSCTPSNDITPITSGNDVIPLTTTGKKWYICGVGKHCEKGMKLAINVLPEFGSPSPSPSSPNGPAAPSAASWIAPDSKFVALIVAAFAMFVAIMN